MDRAMKYFSKLSDKHQTALESKQSNFYIQNQKYVENILSAVDPRELSKDLIQSIEYNYCLAYYYKLRVLADEQKTFFSN